MQDSIAQKIRAFQGMPRRKRFAIGVLTGTILGISSFLLLINTSRDESWAEQHIDQADELSLSLARQIVTTLNNSDARAAVYHDSLVLEIQSSVDLPSVAQEAEGTRKMTDDSNRYLKATLPSDPGDLINSLLEQSTIDLTIMDQNEEESFISSFFHLFMTMALLGAMMILVIRLSMGSRSMGIDSGFEMIRPDQLAHGFESVAGIETARDDLQEIVNFLRGHEDMGRLGGKMPKGLLLEGPPGTGKTHLARAMAKEAGVSFIKLDSSAINQLFAGMGTVKLKKIFKLARENAPCIVFMDEIDAIGKKRGADSSNITNEKDSTLDTLLVEMDGFDPNEGIFIIAATNRSDTLDPALTRRGRLDRRITINAPDRAGREAILAVHAKNLCLAADVDIGRIAGSTYGFTGADLAALANEAALAATRRGADAIGHQDFGTARDRLLVGQSGVAYHLDDEDRRLTAYHEAGHAVIARATPSADPIEKITILPQGGAMGFVMQTPDKDRLVQTKQRLLSRIRIAVAGRAAEALIFGEDQVTSGAASDIRLATQIAQAMVYEYGMSRWGFIHVDTRDPGFMDQANPAWKAMQEIIVECQRWVEEYLSNHREELETVSQLLLTHETITSAQVDRALSGATPAQVSEHY